MSKKYIYSHGERVEVDPWVYNYLRRSYEAWQKGGLEECGVNGCVMPKGHSGDDHYSFEKEEGPIEIEDEVG